MPRVVFTTTEKNNETMSILNVTPTFQRIIKPVAAYMIHLAYTVDNVFLPLN